MPCLNVVVPGCQTRKKAIISSLAAITVQAEQQALTSGATKGSCAFEYVAISWMSDGHEIGHELTSLYKTCVNRLLG